MFELDGSRARDIAAMLERARGERMRALAKPMRPVLGYRGILIEEPAARGARTTRRNFVSSLPDTPGELSDLEDAVLQALGKRMGSAARTGLRRFVKLSLAQPPQRRARRAAAPRATPAHCECAPPYRPTIWNDGGWRQLRNNCYNYSTNYRTDTFAQPGRAAGSMYTSLTGPAVRAAAVRDGLINRPGADNKCPASGPDVLVALVIAPNMDFHWYRKGADGLWTHKVGPQAVTNLDNAGVPIADPRTANRGPYSQFTTFMLARQGDIKLG